MDGLPAQLLALLDDIQRNLLDRAMAFRAEHTQRVASYEEFKQVMEGRPGFVIAPWCGSAVCEAQIKTDTQATIRNMPLTPAAPSGQCIRCDSPARTPKRGSQRVTKGGDQPIVRPALPATACGSSSSRRAAG